MLNDLKILNGNLELKYNKYTYEYTVTVEADINNLEFEYELEEDCYLNIRNNKLNEGENIVYLDVYNVDREETYTLYVYKETTNLVSGIDAYKQSLAVAGNEETETYKIQLLSVGVFILIVVIFALIFRKKKYS